MSLFLRAFRDAADHNSVPEGAAAHIMPYFLEGPAASRCKNQLLRLTGTGIATYPALVSGLLTRYATEAAMSDAYHKLHNIKQDEKETEMEYGTRLLEVAMQAGDVFDERDLKYIVIDGLSSAVRPLVRQLSNPGMDFEALQELVFNSGEAFRGTVHLASKTKTMVSKNRPCNLPGPTVAALEEAPPFVPHHSSTSSEIERAPEVSHPPTYADGDACYELSELPLYPRGLSPTPPSRNWSSATSSPHVRRTPSTPLIKPWCCHLRLHRPRSSPPTFLLGSRSGLLSPRGVVPDPAFAISVTFRDTRPPRL